MAICGDIANSRVARSNLILLNKMENRIRLIAPPTLMPAGVDAFGCELFDDMREGLKGADVVMMLRLQKERMDGGFIPSEREYYHRFGLDAEKLSHAKPDAIVMHLDPGLAFGTGSHPTTRMCLGWLARELRPGQRVIDYGCGSGILALAAMKLGAARAVGVDNDPQALIATADNAQRNGEAIDVHMPQDEPVRSYPVVVANILATALDTLEEAIRKIDRETRGRFKDTFDRVNAGVQELYPRLFGGGHAYLELTGEDLLDTGVAIMARPPGKRVSSISLLSGGEKAMTAVALVFAIFRLNPAPFCLLDEVDAPLDEANVGRFTSLVSEMSEQVQFLFVTCLLYTSPSPRDRTRSRMPSSA